MADKQVPFWQSKSLQEMTRREWESLCDGCGRCCLNKLIDDNTNTIYTTTVACKLLDLNTGRCSNYKHRRKLVADCIMFTPKTLHEYFDWLPDSCAYRLLATGHELPTWHPLVSGHPESVHQAGYSIRGKAVSEEEVPSPQDWFDYIIHRES